MKQTIQQTLKEINTKFKTKKGYKSVSNDNYIYCPQVNGLVSICLRELGFTNDAKEITKNFLNSPSFNIKNKLFYREVGLKGNVSVPFFNTCKNAIFALNLSLLGFKNEAEQILNNLRKSPVYIKDSGLFAREYDQKTGKVNYLLLTQSNLWVALAYLSLGRKKDAYIIVKNLERIRYNKRYELFISQDCREGFTESEKFFSDDQALAVITYMQLGKRKKAELIMESIIKSPLYDKKTGLFNRSFSESDIDTTKSTYKNSLMGIALKKMNHFKELKKLQKSLFIELYDNNRNLFNQTNKDGTKNPDNSALALLVLSYN